MKAAVAGFNRIIKRCPACRADGPKELVSDKSVLRALCPHCGHVFDHERAWGCGTVGALVIIAVGALTVLGWIVQAFSPSSSDPTPAPHLAPKPKAKTVATAQPVAIVQPVSQTNLSPPSPLTKEQTAAAQARALQRYPELGKPGSRLNQEFVTRYRRYQTTNPDFFLDQDWPTKLANESVESLAP